MLQFLPGALVETHPGSRGGGRCRRGAGAGHRLYGMTHIAGGSRRGVPKVWVLPVLALIAILVAISLGLLSRSVLSDLIAWWPVWLVLGVLAFLPRRTMGAGSCLRIGGDASRLLSSVCSSRATSSGGRRCHRRRPVSAARRQARSPPGPLRPDRREARGRVGPVGIPLCGRAGATWRRHRAPRGERATPGPQISPSASTPRQTPGCTHCWVGARSRRGADVEPVIGGEVEADLTRLQLTSLQLDGEARRRWARSRRTSW